MWLKIETGKEGNRILLGGRQEIADRTHGLEEGLTGLSHGIHRHPEIGFQEYETVGAIKTYLRTQGAETK